MRYALNKVGYRRTAYVDFQAWRPTLIVVTTIPFGLVGGVIAILLGGGILSLGALVGFVKGLGIVARNGIMMVSHFRHLEHEEVCHSVRSLSPAAQKNGSLPS